MGVVATLLLLSLGGCKDSSPTVVAGTYTGTATGARNGFRLHRQHHIHPGPEWIPDYWYMGFKRPHVGINYRHIVRFYFEWVVDADELLRIVAGQRTG